jgi:hypothetical protein
MEGSTLVLPDTLDSSRLVFVGGLHRSGTSLLHECLRSHEAISGFSDTGVPKDEGQFLQDAIPPARAFGGPGRFAFDPRSHMLEESSTTARATASELVTQWTPHWDTTSPLLVEKSPPNITRMRRLQSLFPEARFIVIVRHPIPVSLATKRWSGGYRYKSTSSLVAHWLAAHRLLASDVPYIRRLLVLRYEGIVRDPHEAWQSIWTFLGVPVPPVPVEERWSAAPNMRYLREWAGTNRGWIRGALRNRLVDRFETEIRDFGYSLAHPDDLSPPLLGDLDYVPT